MSEIRRADAQRNKARILGVALSAFAEDPHVSLNAIAKRAGVGPGTLYRHFPTREALLLEVYQQQIESLGDSVQLVLDQNPPLEGFRIWARQLAELVRIKHGLGEALETAPAQAIINATYEPVTNAIRRLLDAAESAGDVRHGIDAGDVLLLLSALWRVPPGADGLRQAERLLDMIVDSLAP